MRRGRSPGTAKATGLRGLMFVMTLVAVVGLPAEGQWSWAQDQPVAFIGAHLIPIEGPEVDRGVLVIHGGQVMAVGSEQEVAVPENARRVDVSGRVIMPGLVCTHNHVGGIGGADSTAPIQPDIRIHDSLDIRDPGFRRVVAGGLTTINVMPGSGHLLSGQTIYLKMRKANTIEGLGIRDHTGWLMGGLKMANGTNSMREAPFPGTRAKSAALVRSRFVEALAYREKIARAQGDPSKRPDRDLGLEALVEVLEGRRIVHHHTHRYDDILTVIRLSKEFGFRVVLHHVSEGWKVADEIARAAVPCSVILVDSPGGKLEAREMTFETGAVLERAGVKVAYHTDDWITDSRLFLRSGALGVRAGMSRSGALRSLTLSGAEMLDLGDRIGSLASGKDADFIVLSGDPFSVRTKVLETWVEGVRVFDRSDPADLLFSVGGFGVGKERIPYMCCADEEGPS